LFANIYYNFHNNHIYLWEYDKEGNRQLIEVPYVPYCYIPDKNGSFKDLFGKSCRRKEFSDYGAQREYTKNYESFEGDITPDSRFLIDKYHDKDLLSNLPELNIHFIDIEVSHDDGQPKSGNIKDEILLITVYSSKTKIYHTFGTKNYTGKEKIEYHHCDDEKELLKQYFKWHRSNYPDIITGWFSNRFDIPYILDRTFMLFGEGFLKKYSPVNEVEQRISEDYKDYIICGITLLDYMDLDSKYTQNERESHKLDYVAKSILGYGKLEYEGSLSQLWKDDWNKFVDYNVHDVRLVKEIDERSAFITLTQVQSYFSRVPFHRVDSAMKKFENYLMTLLKSENIVLPTAVRKEKESIPGGYVKETIVGFFRRLISGDFTSLYPHLMFALNLSPETFVGKIGLTTGDKQKDLADNGLMYPCLDVPSLVDEDWYELLGKTVLGEKLKAFIKKNKLILSANGLLFKSAEGFIPKAVKNIFAKRKEFKNLSKENEKKFQETGDKAFDILAKKYDAFQNATKILSNAAYGILANENFRLFDPDLASAITLTGQKLTKYLVKQTNILFHEKFGAEGDQIIAADTDSIYMNLDSFIKKYNIPDDNIKVIASANLFWKKIYEPFLQETLGKFSNEFLNNEINWLHLKREAITDGAIFTGKKHYALNVIDMEGIIYKEPKIKVKGIEIVRSSTPSFCRERIKDVIKGIFKGSTKQQINNLLKDINQKFKSEDVKNIAFPRGVSDVAKYIENGQLVKGTPIQVRAAINYNKLIEKYKLERDYELIKPGAKMKFIYLNTDATNTENIIGFIDNLPKEFGLHKYIDFDTQFEKSFMSPLHKITEAMKWGRIDINISNISEFF